jgi:alpha-D-xyloside xylohydrolase
LGVRVVGVVAAALLLLAGPAIAAPGQLRPAFDGKADGGTFAYRLADGSLHRLGRVLSHTGTEYRVATDEPSRTAVVDVTRTATGARVSFSLKPSTNVVETTALFAGHKGEHFLGGGERQQSLDLAGQSFPVKASSACATPMPAPFYLSSRGYGLALRTTAVASMAFPGSNLSDMCFEAGTPCKLVPSLNDAQVCVKAARFTYDLFLGAPEQVVSDYVRSIGTPEVPPPSALELMKWRDSVPNATPLFHDIEQLKSAGIPIGWEMLDNPWETEGCLGSLTFDSSFGDPATLIRQIHAQGVKLMLWISPLVRLDCPKLPQYGKGALVGSDGPSATIDFTDRAAASAFEASLRKLIALGVDGFKADRGEEADLEGLQLAGGSGVVLQNEYPLLYARAVAAAVKAAGKTATFVSMFHSASPGSAAVAPSFWGGDQPGSFRGLREAVHDALSAGIVGESTWGSDIGGYLPTDSAETFVRWAQLGAISPIFEVGGQGENATFWNYGTATVDLFRSAAILHYELFPYLYSLVQQAHVTGVPVLRAPVLEYPTDEALWKNDYEILVGHDLLAAPVVQPAPTPSPVDLPPGTWVHLATGQPHRGPAALSGIHPLNELPLYLRVGAAIPFAARTPALWPKAWPVDALQMPGRGGWLYAPGGTTTATSSFGVFHATMRGRTVTIALRGAPRETQLELVGVTVARVKGAASVTTQTPFPGTVLRVSPRAGAATITVTLR